MLPRRTALVAAGLLFACDRTLLDGQGLRARSPDLPPETLFVDVAWVGGGCSDARSAEEATHLETPWCSVARALEGAGPGRTVALRAGSYPAVAVSAPSGRSGWLTLRGFPGEEARVAGLTLERDGYLRLQELAITEPASLRDVSHVELSRSRFSPSGAAGPRIAVSGGEAITILDNVFEGSPLTGDGLSGFGVYALSSSGFTQGLTIAGNRFSATGREAIFADSVRGLVVERNEIAECTRPLGLFGCPDVVVRGNFVHGSAIAVYLRNLSGQSVLESNLLVGSAEWAVNAGALTGTRVVNNTVWGNASGGLLLQDVGGDVSTGVVLENNLLDSLAATGSMLAVEDYNLIGSGYCAGAHDLVGNPLFVDPAALDYGLAVGSPAIDSGDCDVAPATDRLGGSRVDDPEVPNSGKGEAPYCDRGAQERTP